MNYKRKSRRRSFLLMRSRTPPISSELGGRGWTPPPRYATVLHYHHYLCKPFLHFSLHHHYGMDNMFSFKYTFIITVTTYFFVFIRVIITWLTHFLTFIYITSLETSKSSFRISDRLYFLLFVCFNNVVTTCMVTYFHYYVKNYLILYSLAVAVNTAKCKNKILHFNQQCIFAVCVPRESHTK